MLSLHINDVEPDNYLRKNLQYVVKQLSSEKILLISFHTLP